jgi:glutaminyl-tRNA synthetase
MTERASPPATDFIREAVIEDLQSGRFERVHTRFPPEPNGYLHIGHAKAITIDFGIARDFGGKCNLRFDDTNPVKEDVEYVDAIMEDIRWLGYDWEERLYYASNYFEQLYQWALELIKKGKAYVDDLSADEIREYRGTLTEAGRPSPYRERTVAENLDLFERMRAGEFPDGSRVLRAKIDMASGNMNLRDPVMYRILHAEHHRTGDAWCIYPMYDYAHGQSDSIEGITHSLCSLEYEDHRPLYEWFLEQLEIYAPRQIEFARLNLNYTVMSKRKLLRLVKEGHVRGWDDPRMPTLSGLRRRGYTPEAIQDFCARIGVGKNDSVIDIALLEHCLREDLNQHAPRRMAILKPLKVVIDNYPEDQVDELEAINNPEQPAAGVRKVPFSKVLYIEQDDFREEPPPSTSAWRPDARCACGTPTSSPAPASSRTSRPARSSNCTAPTTPRRAEATPPTGARSKPRCTGSQPLMPSTPKCVCTTGSSKITTPKPPMRAASSSPTSIPSRWKCCRAASWSLRWRRPRRASASSSSARAISASI